MTEYLPSFIVEPVLRQARRLSRLSSNEESPGFLPAVPESLRTWYPTRLWNTSPPASITEDDSQPASTFNQVARNIQLWTNQIPSPPLEPMNDHTHEEDGHIRSNNASVTEFPALEPRSVQQPRPVRLEHARADSETSSNPLRELPDRSRVHEDGARVHSQSDPAAGTRPRGQTIHFAVPASHDEDTYRRRDGSGILPEDDGMGPLRQRISAIWAGEGTQTEKSRLVHALMMGRYQLTQTRSSLATVSSGDDFHDSPRDGDPMDVVSGASQEVVFNLTAADLISTYAPLDLEDIPDEGDTDETDLPKPDLGCVHYKRNIKMQCVDCERWYTCRLCHDEVENHILPRRQTKYMLCMLCKTPQPASQSCTMCGELAASYFCNVCKLWSNDPRKSIYHCDDCGICRLGQGIGKDFFHCKKCAACMSIKAEDTHKCIEGSTQCDCPICGEYLFTSNKQVAFMNCGHSIHEVCFAEWCNSSYKCPICSKSITNMESQFRRLDRHIAEQPMPEEYQNTKAYIFCNDCSARSTTKFHWLGLKCERCESYNTAQLELLGGPKEITQTQQDEPSEIPSHLTPTGEASLPGGSSSVIPIQTEIPVPLPANVRPQLMVAHSPTLRSVRSISPIVGSYFGTDNRAERTRRGTPMEDDENLDFWGASSPRPEEHDSDAIESDESEELTSSDEVMEDDDGEDDEDDAFDILGHR